MGEDRFGRDPRTPSRGERSVSACAATEARLTGSRTPVAVQIAVLEAHVVRVQPLGHDRHSAAAALAEGAVGVVLARDDFVDPSRPFQALQGVARPGLEPGTPRFQDTAQMCSNCAKSPRALVRTRWTRTHDIRTRFAGLWSRRPERRSLDGAGRWHTGCNPGCKLSATEENSADLDRTESRRTAAGESPTVRLGAGRSQV